MKDYRLSEIRDECRRKRAEKRDCGYIGKCEFTRACHPYLEMDDVPYPFEWDDIEPRDMIDIPCKIPYMNRYLQKKYLVIYRKDNGALDWSDGNNEAEADELLLNSQLVGQKDPIGPRGNRGGCRKTHSFSEFLGNAIEIMTSVFKYGDPSYKYEDMKNAFDDLLHEYERLIAVTRPTQGRQPEERQANINGISVNFVLMPPPIKDPMGPKGPKGVLRTPRSFNEFLGGAIEDIVDTYKHGDLDCRYIDMEATLADLLREYETLIKGDKQ